VPGGDERADLQRGADPVEITEAAGFIFVPKWRALWDSNPCYRRERDIKASMAVRLRPKQFNKGSENGHYLSFVRPPLSSYIYAVRLPYDLSGG
jgi:hypothetical protein